MSKVLTDREVVQILNDTVNDKNDQVIEADQYERFLKDLGELVGNYMGADVVCVSPPALEHPVDDDSSADRWCVHFQANDDTPDDGGIFAQFDTDIDTNEWIGGG